MPRPFLQKKNRCQFVRLWILLWLQHCHPRGPTWHHKLSGLHRLDHHLNNIIDSTYKTVNIYPVTATRKSISLGTVFQKLHYSLRQTVAHYAVTVAGGWNGSNAVIAVAACTRNRGIANPAGHFTGYSSSWRARYHVSVVSVHTDRADGPDTSPIERTKKPFVKRVYLRDTNVCTLLSDFGRDRFTVRFQKLFQSRFRGVGHQVLVANVLEPHFCGEIVGTRTHQEYVRRVLHHFSGQRDWMRDVPHSGNAACERGGGKKIEYPGFSER